MSRRTPILLVVVGALLVLVLLPAAAAGAGDPHAGTDHSQPAPAAVPAPATADPHAGMDHSQPDPAAVPAPAAADPHAGIDQPAHVPAEPASAGGSRTLVLAGFGAVNALVLAGALGVRHRDRRRRVQATAQR